ncbi:MAG: hypothetical protein HN370_03850 [Phycisphaerales bacterium]|jgi:hypothetical protein|nr:hypothetical protein [Phycisphaerales bacterium]
MPKTPPQHEPSVSESEFQALQNELENYRQEKEKIRVLIGQIGGSGKESRWEKRFHWLMIGLLATLLAVDILGAVNPGWKLLPFQVSLEIGVLLVSLKIIWMIQRQTKVDHFQFWILNSIEFRLNDIAMRIRTLETNINDEPES